MRPLGFDVSEKAVRRAGLDYWSQVDLRIWDTIEDYWEQVAREQARCHLLTTKAKKAYWEVEFQRGDHLIFGSETRGLPEEILEAYPSQCLKIPMADTAIRSLNLATAAGIVLYEGVRQISTRVSAG